MDCFDPKHLSLSAEDMKPEGKPFVAKRLPRHQPGESFLKGPIPLNWLKVAAKCPGKSLQVAVAIWHIAGMKNEATFALSSQLLAEFGVAIDAKRRALRELEGRELIAVRRGPGRLPVVTLLEVGVSHETD